MFEALTERLGGVFRRLRGEGVVRAEHLDEALREIRTALLEADVSLPVVRESVDNVRAKAAGAEVLEGLNPVQQVVQIVRDEVAATLGVETRETGAGQVCEITTTGRTLPAVPESPAGPGIPFLSLPGMLAFLVTLVIMAYWFRKKRGRDVTPLLF